MADVWKILTAVSPVIAPIVSLFLALVGKIIWNQEQRIRDLERGTKRQSRTIYGDSKDARQSGLADDIRNLEQRVETIEEKVDEIYDEVVDVDNE